MTCVAAAKGATMGTQVGVEAEVWICVVAAKGATMGTQTRRLTVWTSVDVHQDDDGGVVGTQVGVDARQGR